MVRGLGYVIEAQKGYATEWHLLNGQGPEEIGERGWFDEV